MKIKNLENIEIVDLGKFESYVICDEAYYFGRLQNL